MHISKTVGQNLLKFSDMKDMNCSYISTGVERVKKAFLGFYKGILGSLFHGQKLQKIRIKIHFLELKCDFFMHISKTVDQNLLIFFDMKDMSVSCISTGAERPKKAFLGF